MLNAMHRGAMNLGVASGKGYSVVRNRWNA